MKPEGSSGTQLNQQGTLTFRGFWRLIEPFVGREISTGELKELEKFKSVIESD